MPTVLTITTTGTTNWTCPLGVTTVQVELWGGGGAGGVASGTASGAGGGAGGQYAIKQVTVTPGNVYAVVVGAVATAVITGGVVTNGNDSTFATTTVVAKGGPGGADATGATGTGGAGSTTGGVGDTVFAGGSGGNGVSSTVSAGGGGGAGSSGTGNSGSGQTAGIAKANNGGAGGTGVSVANTRNAGNNYGGGGSGGLSNSATNRAGGNGAQGLAVLTYTLPLTATLTDDFSSQDTAKWSGYGTGVVATGGQLVLTPTTSVQRTLTALGTFDLTGSSLYVQCVQFPNDAAQCWMGMSVQNAVDTNDSEQFLIYKNGPTGDLQFREQVNGVQDNTTLSWTSGNAIAHAWWKLSESGGNILWDTSSDGVSFSNQRTKAKAAGVDVTNVQVTLFAYSDAVTPGTYIFDYLNVAPAGAAASLVIPRQRLNYGSLTQL